MLVKPKLYLNKRMRGNFSSDGYKEDCRAHEEQLLYPHAV